MIKLKEILKEEKLTEAKKFRVYDTNTGKTIKIVNSEKAGWKFIDILYKKYGNPDAGLAKVYEEKLSEDFGMAAKQMPKFSSREAQSVIDGALRDYAKILRKAQQKVIKDWMSKAKSGVVDYFDLVRGLQYGDASRAYPYETKFLMSILNKDKIMNRFKSYFGGKKGKKR